MGELAGSTPPQVCEASVTITRESWGVSGTVECARDGCDVPLEAFRVDFDQGENDLLVLRRQMARFLCRVCPLIEEPKGFEPFPTSQLPLDIRTGGKKTRGGFNSQNQSDL